MRVFPQDGRRDQGMVTAEYTVGLLGAVGLTMILFRLGRLRDPDPGVLARLVRDFFERAFELPDLVGKLLPWF